VLFFFGLGWRDFWAPVEPRYAEIARVMFSKGEWIVPTVNGDLYTDKPILYFWLVLIASKFVGAVNEWTVRLPSALAGMGVVLTTYAIGQTFFSTPIGLIAAAVLATSFRVIWESRWAHTDMVFLFFFTLSMYLTARSLFRRGHRDQILLAYAFMGLATLSKGLIGVVLPALILLAYMAVRRDWRMLRDAKLLLGIGIFVIVAGPWFYLVSRATHGKWLMDFIYIHHIQRYTAGAGHRQPFYYYFTTLPVDFLPWTIFLIPALFAGRLDRKGWGQSESLFFILWLLVVFLFFSFSDTKRDLYLLPLFPPLAIYIACYLNDLIQDATVQSSSYRGLTLTFFGLLMILGLAAPVGARFLRPDAFWISIPGGCVMAAGGFFAVRFIRMRAPLNMVGAVTVMMAATIVTASIWIFPYVENFKSVRPFSQEIKKIVPSGIPLYVFADTMDDFNYYLEREVIPVVRSRATVEKLLSQPRSGYMLIKTKDLIRVKMISELRLVATESLGSTTWNLVALHP
jgi:4-amino-4-deoxy-L-arabinose transferase-like glycosyltransferase